MCTSCATRDIAFSGNQSPVQKFYKASFADAAWRHARAWAHFPEHGINLQAMALWADWNGALLRWARRQGGAPYAPDDGRAVRADAPRAATRAWP